MTLLSRAGVQERASSTLLMRMRQKSMAMGWTAMLVGKPARRPLLPAQVVARRARAALAGTLLHLVEVSSRGGEVDLNQEKRRSKME
jgi:hypothetical protein